MSGIDSASFIDELTRNIAVKDAIKARAVLAHLPEVDERTRQRTLLDLSRCDDDFSVPLLGFLLATFPDLAGRYPTLREMLLSKVLDRPRLLGWALKGGKAEEKILFISILGQVRFEQEVDLLLDLLTSEEDERVIEAALSAIGNTGDPRGASSVSEFLYSGRLPLVQAAIHALGQIATPTAVQRLAERLGTDSELDMLIVDVLAQIQDQQALQELNNILRSHHAHLRNHAKARLTGIGAKAVPMLAENLHDDDPDLIIHSLNILGAIGDGSAIPAVRKVIYNQHRDPNVRFAAYEALGLLPYHTGAFILAGGLTDPVEHVRSAAAKAIDRNLNDVLAAGIKNLVRDGGEEAGRVTRIILDTQADNIFLSLLEEDSFQDLVLPHLRHAHPEVREHFRELLAENGYRRLAAELALAGKAQEAAAKGLRVFAVDDSRMILSIYRASLHAMGHESMLFEFPAQAVRRLEEDKPDILLTDLNMPDMTGIDLARTVRRLYSSGELPIVMVTTQNDRQDNEAATAAGVDAIMRKPFTQEELAAVIDRLCRRT